MRITQALLGEHGAIYALFDLIEKTVTAAELTELRISTKSLHCAIGSHAAIEDEVLRPAIQNYLPAPAGPSDHDVIDAGLAKVLASETAEEARRTLLETIAFARKHFLKEETIIFGIASRELSGEVQEQLGAEWARRRGVILS
jgi:hemerythrin-like domain-containing protein